MKRYEAEYYRTKAKERRIYMRKMGLCDCGERARPGKVRCERCAQIYAVKEKMRRDSMTPEQKEHRALYMKEYQSRPENAARAKEKRKVYDATYRKKCKEGWIE